MTRDLTNSNSLINPGVLLGFHWVVVVASLGCSVFQFYFLIWLLF
jgi:hypothetical protein